MTETADPRREPSKAEVFACLAAVPAKWSLGKVGEIRDEFGRCPICRWLYDQAGLNYYTQAYTAWSKLFRPWPTWFRTLVEAADGANNSEREKLLKSLRLG